jgi:predicted nucleic acid-binding protein
LLSVKHGKFLQMAVESKTVLVTSDKALAEAAKAEGLQVWNPEKSRNHRDY